MFKQVVLVTAFVGALATLILKGYPPAATATTNQFDIRQESYDILRNSLSPDRREKSDSLLQELHSFVRYHDRLHNHPILEVLPTGEAPKEAIVDLHMEFRKLANTFTDQITAVALQTRRLRAEHGDDVSFAARYLIFLNLLDELGFEPGENEYRGSPRNSHKLLFEDVITDLGVTLSLPERDASPRSPPTQGFMEILESTETDLMTLLLYLVVAEEEVMIFTPAMRASVQAMGIDVDSGYYMVHGTSDDDETNASDDLHQKDAWAILGLILNDDNFDEAKAIADTFLTLWCEFWDVQHARIADSGSMTQEEPKETILGNFWKKLSGR